MAMNDDERKRLETAVNTANTAYLLVIGLLGELRAQGRTETATNQMARAEECAVAMSMSNIPAHKQDGTRALRELEELRRQVEKVKPEKVPADLDTLRTRLDDTTATANASLALIAGMLASLTSAGQGEFVAQTLARTDHGVAMNSASEDPQVASDAMAYFERIEMLRTLIEEHAVTTAFAAADVPHKTVQ